MCLLSDHSEIKLEIRNIPHTSGEKAFLEANWEPLGRPGRRVRASAPPWGVPGTQGQSGTDSRAGRAWYTELESVDGVGLPGTKSPR